MLYEGFFDPRKPLTIRWGELPHWRQDGATYFVTFRLADSLPQRKLAEWRHERDELLLRFERDSESFHEALLEQLREMERWLDRGLGSCLLADPAMKGVGVEALKFFDGMRYELGEYTVAPNHVHALLRMAVGVDLSEVLSSWKKYSARRIRWLSRLSGGPKHLWQTESFDHIVRNQRSLEKFSAYIRNHRSSGESRS